jgi:hypothetical protein
MLCMLLSLLLCGAAIGHRLLFWRGRVCGRAQHLSSHDAGLHLHFLPFADDLAILCTGLQGHPHAPIDVELTLHSSIAVLLNT